MRKGLSFLSVIMSISLILAGCTKSKASLPPSTASASSGSEQPESLPKDTITLGTEIIQLEPGLSAVRFDGDYGFDRFLEQGGAAGDREVVEYLAENLIGDLGLDFLGNLFGCSTIAAQSPTGNSLFGRNFDWNRCDVMKEGR